jgi:hypothetical protein
MSVRCRLVRERRLPTEAATPRLAALGRFLSSLQMQPFDATCADVAADIRVGLGDRPLVSALAVR